MSKSAFRVALPFWVLAEPLVSQSALALGEEGGVKDREAGAVMAMAVGAAFEPGEGRSLTVHEAKRDGGEEGRARTWSKVGMAMIEVRTAEVGDGRDETGKEPARGR